MSESALPCKIKEGAHSSMRITLGQPTIECRTYQAEVHVMLYDVVCGM